MSLSNNSRCVGFLVDDLGGSQLSFFLTTALNGWLKQSPQNDAVVFYDNLEIPCTRPDFALMQSIDAATFDGVLVATSYATALKALASKGPQRRYFYLQDLEWMRRPGSFDDWQAVYGHPDLRLVARSLCHALVVEKCWGKPCGVAETPLELLRELEAASCE